MKQIQKNQKIIKTVTYSENIDRINRLSPTDSVLDSYEEQEF